MFLDQTRNWLNKKTQNGMVAVTRHWVFPSRFVYAGLKYMCASYIAQGTDTCIEYMMKPPLFLGSAHTYMIYVQKYQD